MKDAAEQSLTERNQRAWHRQLVRNVLTAAASSQPSAAKLNYEGTNFHSSAYTLMPLNLILAQAPRIAPDVLRTFKACITTNRPATWTAARFRWKCDRSVQPRRPLATLKPLLDVGLSSDGALPKCWVTSILMCSPEPAQILCLRAIAPSQTERHLCWMPWQLMVADGNGKCSAMSPLALVISIFGAPNPLSSVPRICLANVQIARNRSLMGVDSNRSPPNKSLTERNQQASDRQLSVT